MISIKNFLFVLLFIMVNSQNSFSQNRTVADTTLEKIRNLYYSSVEDENDLRKLESLITDNFSDTLSQYPPVILAYYGGVEALKAKHAFWPFNKLSHFNSSMDILKTAVKEEPDNLEIRFIRFSILDNVPGILGFSKERETDKDEIVFLLCNKDYSELNFKIQNNIIQYMLNSGRLSPEQINLLTKTFPEYSSK
ncbi:MAG: hypothetical protein P8Z35_18305 [Ignavibacteriaceae bacterium]